MSDADIPDRTRLPLDVLDQIDRACDHFESAWARGDRPRIEDFVGEVTAPYRRALLRDLLAAELAARRSKGENPRPDEYRERLAGDDSAVDSAFGLAGQTTDAAILSTRESPAPPDDADLGATAPHPGSGPRRTNREGPAGGDVAPGLPRGTMVRYFGDYEIHEELGRGGMGIVYRARQVSLNRPVALKMVRSGAIADAAELRRFQNEAEAVALLDHPGIVPIYEVGEHQEQRYFSMRLVEGGTLAQRIASFRDDPRAAAMLVAEAAEAVHHAHMRGILHRDLKPANILIDAEGHPHVGDFGLAKRVESDFEFTASGAILGTPAYMSPEQATGRRGAITTATDVYGLGTILYALLTGKAPFGGDSVVETLDAVRNNPPEPPTRLNARVPRDLETIALKCLEKDPRRRYTGANDLARDLRAWLGDCPISARRVGTAERAWLLCKRQPALAGLGAALALALLGGIAGIVWNWREAVHQRNIARGESVEKEKQRKAAVIAEREARSEADKAEAILGFLVDDILGQAAPKKNHRNRQVTIEEALDLSSPTIGERFAGKPDVEVAVRTMIGRTYSELGELDKAEPHLQRALDLSLETSGEDAWLATTVMDDLATLLQHQGRLAEAEALFRRRLKVLQRVWGANHTETMTATNNLALLLQFRGKLDEAETLFRQVVLASTEKLGADHPSTLIRTGNLAGLIKARGRWAEATLIMRRVLEAQTRVLGPEHPDTLKSLNGVGQFLTAMNESEEATRVLRECLAIRIRVLGPQHFDTLISMNNLAIHLDQVGDYEEAEPLIRRCLEIRVLRLGPDHADTLMARAILATVLQHRGRFAEAESIFRQTLESSNRHLGEDHPDSLLHAHNLGLLLALRGKHSEAERVMRHVLELRRSKLGSKNPMTLLTMNNLASLLAKQRRFGEAEPLTRECLEARREVLGRDHLHVITSLTTLAALLLAEGRPKDAERLLREAVATSRRVLPSGHSQTTISESRLGECLTALGHYDEAERLVVPSFRSLRDAKPVIPGRSLEALDRIIRLYELWGKPEQAAAWRAMRLDVGFPVEPFVGDP